MKAMSRPTALSLADPDGRYFFPSRKKVDSQKNVVCVYADFWTTEVYQQQTEAPNSKNNLAMFHIPVQVCLKNENTSVEICLVCHAANQLLEPLRFLPHVL